MKLPRREASSEIPTSSMADIAFLLIIFFMVTAVFSATKGLEFKLPQEDESKAAEADEAPVIGMDEDTVTLICSLRSGRLRNSSLRSA